MIRAPGRSSRHSSCDATLHGITIQQGAFGQERRSGGSAVCVEPALVELRRQVCPNARWQKHRREWLMQDNEAQSFMRAAQAALEYQKWHTQITVDDTVWIVGFVQAAPYRLTAARAA
jgi:hypothetical protein